MVFPVLLLLGSAALIYVGCEFFVNGVEWLGRKLGIAQNAVGTVLAAFGTALPESVVTFCSQVSRPSPMPSSVASSRCRQAYPPASSKSCCTS